MWTNTHNSGRSTRASMTQTELPANPSREEWNEYLNSLRCSVPTKAEEVIRLILDYPSTGWCPLVDYLEDGRESLSSRCGFDKRKLMVCRNMFFGSLDMKTMLKDTFRISAEAVYKDHWFAHFNRGHSPPSVVRGSSDSASSNWNRGARVGPESWLQSFGEGQKFLDQLNNLLRKGKTTSAPRRVGSPMKSAVLNESAAKTSTIVLEPVHSKLVEYLNHWEAWAKKKQRGGRKFKYLGQNGKLLAPTMEERLELVKKAGLWDYLTKIELPKHESKEYRKQLDRANVLLGMNATEFQNSNGLQVNGPRGSRTRIRLTSHQEIQAWKKSEVEKRMEAALCDLESAAWTKSNGSRLPPPSMLLDAANLKSGGLSNEGFDLHCSRNRSLGRTVADNISKEMAQGYVEVQLPKVMLLGKRKRGAFASKHVSTRMLFEHACADFFLCLTPFK